MYSQQIEIHNIFTSPQHHYFTRKKFDVGDAITIEHKTIHCNVDRGLKGDRFEFSTYPITFMALEVAQTVCRELELEFDVKLFRRNIIISGVNLNALIKEEFIIDGIIFEGMEHCAPCTWMNAVMKKGAYSLMAGRGGLRAKVKKNGTLKVGKTLLHAGNSKILESALTALKKPKLP